MSATLSTDLARDTRTGLMRGEDSAPYRERAEPTFKQLAERYLKQHAELQKKSWKRDEKRIETHFSKWDSRRLTDISIDDVVKAQQSVKENYGPVEANQAITLLCSMFKLAWDWEYLSNDYNPAARIKRLREERRERFLSPEEFLRLNAALAAEPGIYWRTYFALSVMLGTRHKELLAVRWSDLDLDGRIWRIPVTKSGRSCVLPIPAPAVELFKSLPAKDEDGFVFRGRGKTGHLVEPRKAWKRIRKAAKLPDVKIRDLRRTLRKWLAAEGYRLPLIGCAPNHTNVSSTSIYVLLSLDSVHDPLEKNTALLNQPSETRRTEPVPASIVSQQRACLPRPHMAQREWLRQRRVRAGFFLVAALAGILAAVWG